MEDGPIYTFVRDFMVTEEGLSLGYIFSRAVDMLYGLSFRLLLCFVVCGILKAFLPSEVIINLINRVRWSMNHLDLASSGPIFLSDIRIIPVRTRLGVILLNLSTSTISITRRLRSPCRVTFPMLKLWCTFLYMSRGARTGTPSGRFLDGRLFHSTAFQLPPYCVSGRKGNTASVSSQRSSFLGRSGAIGTKTSECATLSETLRVILNFF